MKRIKSFVSSTYSRLKPQPSSIALFYSNDDTALLKKISRLKPVDFLNIREHESNCTIMDLAVK